MTIHVFQLVATALVVRIGHTVSVIEHDGFVIAESRIPVSGDTSTAVAKSVGLGVIGLPMRKRLQPEWLLVLGDRFEVFAAAQPALMATIPIVHIAGATLPSAFDRPHSISKMAQLPRY